MQSNFQSPEVISLRMSPEPDLWWQSASGALAWIAGLLIEGFAVCGASMHPGFSSLSARTTLSAED
jgi:hypothetical protein